MSGVCVNTSTVRGGVHSSQIYVDIPIVCIEDPSGRTRLVLMAGAMYFRLEFHGVYMYNSVFLCRLDYDIDVIDSLGLSFTK